MSSCLLPTIQILQPSTTNPVLRPKLTRTKSQANPQPRRRKKTYPTGPATPPSRFTKMRLAVLRNSALVSLVGWSSAQTSPSTWAQTQPFTVGVSTESLLPSSQQPLTNVVGSSTPATTALPPVAPISDEFSTTMPTELSTVVLGTETSVVTVTSSVGSAASAGSSADAAGSTSASASASESASARSSSSRASSSSSGTGAATLSTAAAAPVGVKGQQKMMGVAGALAGAAGVLFV